MMETASASVIFLLLVAVVAIAIGLVARQWRRPQALGGLQVLSTTPLGQRERLVEVLHGDEILVLGVTHQSINLLDRRKASVAEQERLVAHRGLQRSPASARFLGTAFVLFFAAFSSRPRISGRKAFLCLKLFLAKVGEPTTQSRFKPYCFSQHYRFFPPC